MAQTWKSGLLAANTKCALLTIAFEARKPMTSRNTNDTNFPTTKERTKERREHKVLATDTRMNRADGAD